MLLVKSSLVRNVNIIEYNILFLCLQLAYLNRLTNTMFHSNIVSEAKQYTRVLCIRYTLVSIGRIEHNGRSECLNWR